MFDLFKPKEIKIKTSYDCILQFAHDKNDWFDPDELSRDFTHVLAKYVYYKLGRRFAPSTLWRKCRTLASAKYDNKLIKMSFPIGRSNKVFFKLNK